MGMESPAEAEEDRGLRTEPRRLDSLPVQESPFSITLNNLSPIKPAKAANVAQAFSRFNSSPLVFASPPTIKLQPRTDHLKRNEMFESPNEEHSVRKDDLPDSSQKSKELVDSVSEESSDSKDMLRIQSCSSFRIADGFLTDPFEADCLNSTHLSGQHGNCSKRTSEFHFHCEGDSTIGFGREDTDVQLVSPEQSNADAEKLFTCDGPTVEAEEYHETVPSFSVICDVAMGQVSDVCLEILFSLKVLFPAFERYLILSILISTHNEVPLSRIKKVVALVHLPVMSSLYMTRYKIHR